MPWDWFVIDTSYILVLIGGAMIFRTRRTGVGAWISFGLLSALVGAGLMLANWYAQLEFAAASSGDAIALLKSAC